MPNYCSPSKKKNNNINSCYDSSELVAIAKAYNNYIKNNKLCNKIGCSDSSTPIDIKYKDDKYVYKELSKRLNPLCKGEFCWTDMEFINYIPDKELRKTILYFTFKPKGLHSKRTWFNTNNINEIMEQYQDLHKSDFKFLGAQPSDFNKLVKLNWDSLRKKKYIGIIFNTDTHTQPGKHWVATFIDNDNKTLEYFDSLGHIPNKYISSFLKHFKDYKFTINRRTHQRGDSNCGVYSCFFIIQSINGLSFDDINKKIITDKMMSDYRDILFRPTI